MSTGHLWTMVAQSTYSTWERTNKWVLDYISSPLTYAFIWIHRGQPDPSRIHQVSYDSRYLPYDIHYHGQLLSCGLSFSIQCSPWTTNFEGTMSCNLHPPPTHEVPNTKRSRPGSRMPIRPLRTTRSASRHWWSAASDLRA